ncbi:GroES-like protein [Trametes versicolor FP-101664 SS1]|uniref:GroES-like protein n=1 Tax=Trametes versicolor (strain FP-101664) TaxID=717944 RepID=UPI0004623DC9|nr:GroES-like protein [Trametes versicolor FP-101664 SS1]EIW62534.1 GroES-like protein [Trametes versicolor FP-101664 SS1]
MSSSLQFKGYALTDPSYWSDLKVVEFKPKNFQPEDIEISITHCGVCGSDLHTLTQGWGESKLPLIAGHEIVGTVTRVGDRVTGFKPGDRVGVGAQIGACLNCKRCDANYENYCPEQIDTYNAEYPDGVVTQGGYATAIRAHERFVFAIPKNLESRHAASMLCAGLTVYSPLKTNGAGPGKTVGIIGIGGLGHYAVLFAKALGADVYAFTHDATKVKDIKQMGAHHVINTSEQKDFAKSLAGEFDIIISTLDSYSPETPLADFLSMLVVHGKLITVGIPDADNPLPPIHPFDLMSSGALLGGSHIGSKKECIEMLQLAAEKGVKPWIEELPMKEVGKALRSLGDNKVRYRYVLTQDLV